MALHTRLSADEARAILAAYGFELETLEPLPDRGTVNSNFRVRASGRLFFLRVNEGKRDQDVRAEADLVTALRAGGVPTPEILAPIHLMQSHQSDVDHLMQPHQNVWGDLMHVHQKPVTLFPWVAGREAQPIPDAPSVRAVGRGLALLHRAGQALPSSTWPRDHYRLEELASRLASFDGDPRFSEVAPQLGSALARAMDRALRNERGPVGLIHQDLFPDNLLVDERGELSAILDLEQATGGPLAYDLAVALNAWCWDGERIVPDAVESVLAAYRQSAPEPLGALAQLDARLLDEARLAAARFTITRITDVFLPDGVDEGLKRRKDWRDYARRLEYWNSQTP
jgi:homoserine kinase type II